MKRYLLPFLFFTASVSISRAQYVAIPDTAFLSWLNINGFSQCLNGNLLDTSCQSVLTATEINCSAQNIHDLSGITYFKNVTRIDCSHNYQTTLPALPSNLQSLDCHENWLTSLPELPVSLIYLWCYGNEMDSFPVLPSNLLLLDCMVNYLSHLPDLPNSLNSLNCSMNQITVLPNLPPVLNTLDCSSNYIGNLPTLPSGLKNLSCSMNPLGVLPTLPDSLVHLFCRNNNLISIPVLPNSLRTLKCMYNDITTLPVLPSNLTELWAGNNQLNNLPAFPDSLYYCLVDRNTNLTCLPELKRIVNLDFENTSITCLPSYGNVTNSTPVLSSVPLCDALNNSNNCQIFSAIIALPNSYINLSLSPNPFINSLSLSIQKENLQQADFTITNIIGQPVYAKHESNLSSNYSKTLDLSYLPVGVYFLQVIADGERSVRQLVKQ